MWYIQFNLPNSAPYRYLTIKNGKATSTGSIKGAVLFQNKLQAISAAESAISTDKKIITSYILRNWEE